MLRSTLSAGNPYKINPDFSLQALGFVDPQRRFLPKALNYVPELEQRGDDKANDILLGRIKSLRAGRYGFIMGDAGEEYFFHQSDLDISLKWESVEADLRV